MNMMENKKNAISTLSARVRGHDLVKNRFILQMEDRNLISIHALKAWAEQQYFMSISLSQCFAALYVRSPIAAWHNRLILLELASEEAWGNGPGNHGSAFQRFYQSLGGNLAELDNLIAGPETIAAAQGRLDLCRGERGYDLAESALALAYGNEFANLFIFGKLRRALRKSEKSEIDLSYFDAHVSDETIHNKGLVDFAFSVWNQESSTEAAVQATDFLLDLRRQFFDAVADRLEISGIKSPMLETVGCSAA